MKSNIFERIKVLYFGSSVSFAEVVLFHEGRVEHESICLQTGGKGKGSKIMGYEIMSKKLAKQRLMEIVEKSHHDHLSDYYFYTMEKKHIHTIIDIIEELSLGESQIYGIDPDYFYSFVPISGSGHKVIEKYILNMKNDYSIKGLIKNFLKRALINVNLSGRLYESFVVTVSSRNSKLNPESRC